mmetsp:Transcript_33733/g.54135  ORF Transcript_33733/g.54135 Transcript_33733/m.54135 type:complete len:744 (+) Transcript_33733:480-2711(+)
MIDHFQDSEKLLVHEDSGVFHKGDVVRAVEYCGGDSGEYVIVENSENIQGKLLRTYVRPMINLAPTPPRPDDDRTLVMEEILSSERSFREFLHALDTVYGESLKQELTANEHKLCFGSVQQLLQFSDLFIVELEKGIREQCIGKIYCQYAPFFKMYNAYSALHAQITEMFEEIREKRDSFNRICEQCKADPRCKGQSLLSIQIMPIQRIPRHLLLLKELRKHTPMGTDDLLHIEKAMVAVGKIAESMNQGITDTENSVKVLEIQRLLCPQPELFKTGRKFVRSGTLKKRTHDGFFEELMFFLFSDCLVYCKPMKLAVKTAKYHFRRMVHVAKVSILQSGANEIDEFGDSPVPLRVEEDEDEPFPHHRRSFSSCSSAGSFTSTEISGLSPVPSASTSIVARITPGGRLKNHLYPFHIHATKSLVVFAGSESEREAWVSDLELHANPEVITDVEQVELEKQAQRRQALEKVQLQVKNVQVSDPVRVYSATAWVKLHGNVVNKGLATTDPEIHIQFQLSKTGRDLRVSGPMVNPLSVLSLSVTLLSARGLESTYVKGGRNKAFVGVYCQLTFGKSLHKTKVFPSEDTPTWMEAFGSMPFIAGMFSSIGIQVRQAMSKNGPKTKDPCLAVVDICLKDIMYYTGIKVLDNDSRSGVIRDETSKATKKKRSKMKSPKGFQITSSMVTDEMKKTQIRPQTQCLPLSIKKLPPVPSRPQSLPNPIKVRPPLPPVPILPKSDNNNHHATASV